MAALTRYSLSPVGADMTHGRDNGGCESTSHMVTDPVSSVSPNYTFSTRSSGRSDSMDGKEHELMHASDMSVSSHGSAIKVEIADVDGDDSINLTTTTLKRCKRQVLRPYWRLLMFIGWRGFGRESVSSGSCRYLILNVIYPLIIMIILLYTYVYEMVACQWKLDITKDTQIVTTTVTPITSSSPNTTDASFFPMFTFDTPAFLTVQNITQKATAPPEACRHIITTYVIPNFLHFVAFIMGLSHFRVQENEQLYALMEKVFLQAMPLYNRTASQQKMIRKLRLYQIGGAFWVLLTLGLQGLYVWAFDFPKLAFFHVTGLKMHWVLFAVDMLGIMVLNSVNLAVIGNYVTQCEMILFYVRGVTLRLQEKSTDIKTAMKDVLTVRQNLSLLNGPIAKMTSLVVIIFGELTVIGFSILFLNKNEATKVWVYRGIFPFVWMIMLFCPLFQAARVNSVCKRFIKTALEMRVFGYKSCSQLELDSFLLFVSMNKLQAKIFHIPVLPSYLIASVVMAAFVVLILFQTSIIGPSNYMF